jgi:hypothetical protein
MLMFGKIKKVKKLVAEKLIEKFYLVSHNVTYKRPSVKTHHLLQAYGDFLAFFCLC